ncbi:MAG: DUF3365 domain-containing protein, partial [Verrucomicrobiota bacterium]
MKKTQWIAPTLMVGALIITTGTLVGCSQSTASPTGIDPKIVADSLFTVMEADRATYTKKIVKRVKTEGKIDVVEEWEDSGNTHLPLPAQMFRMAAERARDSKHNSSKFFYQLKSPWPINKQNEPTTDVE